MEYGESEKVDAAPHQPSTPQNRDYVDDNARHGSNFRSQMFTVLLASTIRQNGTESA